MSEEIIQYIETELLSSRGEITITADEDLLTSGLLQSLSIMKLIHFIETKYNVKVPPEDMVIEHFISVDAIEEYLKNVID